MLKKLTFSILFTLFLSTSALAQSKFWKSLIPDQAGLQYAGSIGFISAGAGYDLLNEKAALNFNVGYIPESLGGELTIISVKFQYKPFNIPIGDKIIIQPFNPVFFPSYTLGQNFDFKFEKPKYQEGYYFWSSALRLHLGASTEVKILNKPDAKIKALSLYAEANTNDLYLLSWFKNRTYTPFYRMFKMGYGVKMYF
ncbi:MAG: hypothetical protein EOO93_15510 [Pedobacter sp.]|nr:MAG: hypothetical protein EOO93_15510 [Pedobacter sp.]